MMTSEKYMKNTMDCIGMYEDMIFGRPVKSEFTYTFTESELSKIKEEEREKAREEITNYIAFAVNNYPNELDPRGIVQCLEDVTKFLKGETNLIPNTEWKTFDTFIKQKEIDPAAWGIY